MNSLFKESLKLMLTHYCPVLSFYTPSETLKNIKIQLILLMPMIFSDGIKMQHWEVTS